MTVKRKKISLFNALFVFLFIVVLGLLFYSFYMNSVLNREIISFFEKEQENSSITAISLDDEQINSLISIYLENEKTAEKIYKFFDRYTNSRRISTSIISNCLQYNVPVSLATSIAWTESKFIPLSINNGNSNGSSDYGLFQVNDVHLSGFSHEEKLNIENNSQIAISFLSDLLKTHNYNLILVIAAYNAGTAGIQDGIGRSTLLHLSSTVSFKNNFERSLSNLLLNIWLTKNFYSLL